MGTALESRDRRDHRGWRIPTAGTVGRRVYDVLIYGLPLETLIAALPGIGRSTIKSNIWQIQNYDKVIASRNPKVESPVQQARYRYGRPNLCVTPGVIYLSGPVAAHPAPALPTDDAAARRKALKVIASFAQEIEDPDIVRKIDDTLSALFHARQAAAIIHKIDKPCPIRPRPVI